MEAIVTSLISAGFAAVAAIIVGLLNTRATYQKTIQLNNATITEILHRQELHQQEINATHQQTIALIECKLDNLTNEVREHNNFAKRMPILEEQMKVANHRIDDLEREGK